MYKFLAYYVLIEFLWFEEEAWAANSPHICTSGIIGCHYKSKADKGTIWLTMYTTSNKNFILKYFRCRDGKRTETRIGMEGICITHSCIPLYTVYMQHIMAHSGGMQEWVIQIPSIPILVSVLFPSLHLKYFRIKFLLLVCIVFMRMRTKPHPHPVIS